VLGDNIKDDAISDYDSHLPLANVGKEREPIDTAGTFVGASIVHEVRVEYRASSRFVFCLSFFMDGFLCISPKCLSSRPWVPTCFLYVDHISLFISAVLCTNTGKKELVCTTPGSKFTFG
jgi:hypothetical protein